MLTLLIMILLLLFAYMTIWFTIALKKRDNGIADVAWGLGFVLVAWVSFWLVPTPDVPRKWLLNILVTIWGVRLAGYIYIRNQKKEGEDFRYKKWREDWGDNWVMRSFLQVFMLQGFLLFLISLPIIATNMVTAAALNGLDGLGIALFTIGFLFEAIADYQLYVFKNEAANKGKIMTTGLWQYSRHPNYFGETLVWWGIYILALNSVFPYITLISPILITFLLTRVSGVPMLESKYKNNPEYKAYREQTSAFIPWRKKSRE